MSGPHLRTSAALVATVLAMTPAGAVAARPRPITGTLSLPGYTLIALAADGKATSVAPGTRPFRLRPRAQTVTLHLRGPEGLYAGPVVIERRGRLATVGVRAGARLGRIAVRPGYAVLARRAGRREVDRRRVAKARRGIPIGVRAFGRVRSKPPRHAVPGDRDKDGIPNQLDIDDDGDRVLDGIDRSSRASAAQARPELPFEFSFGVPIDETANVNAAGLSVAQMDELLVKHGLLLFAPVGDFAELDCGGLTYCSRGGTGHKVRPGAPGSDLGAFPDAFDPDGDGFGTLGDGVLQPRATTAQIGTGNVLIQHVSDSTGLETGQFAATLTYVFASVPALVSFDDGEGHSQNISYAIDGRRAGTLEDPLPVKAGPGNDVVIEVRLWRPQRRAIPPETSDFYDIGGLIWEVEGGSFGKDCPQRAFSSADPSLTPAPMTEAGAGEEPTGGLRDLAADRPASSANMLGFVLNLTACLETFREESPREDWKRGEVKSFSFRATDRKGYTGQDIAFKLL